MKLENSLMNRITLALLGLLLVACTGELPRKVDYPHYAFRNVSTQELVCVERTDTATILSFKSFFQPHFWIRVAPGVPDRREGPVRPERDGRNHSGRVSLYG